MSRTDQCEFCEYMFPAHRQTCHHCGRPSRFPNVLDAKQDENRDALDDRYSQSVDSLDQRSCQAVRKRFERAMADNTRAVLARPFAEARRLATSDRQIYSTYYGLIDAEIMIPEGNQWDVLRQTVDPDIFRGYHEEMRFAALAEKSVGTINYGECSLVLRDDMISYRATVFEENTVHFATHRNIPRGELAERAQGYLATWADRARLCVCKLHGQLEPRTQDDEFHHLLLTNGATTADDKFIEVHIYGPMTIRTVSHVTVVRKKNRPSKIAIRELKWLLDKMGITLEIQ